MADIRTISTEEAAEFRGLFFGEGHIDLMKNGRSNTLTPRVRIAVRDDDASVVEWCRDLFGGCLTYEARTRSVCWYAVGKDRVAAVVAALTGGSVPSKKRAEVELLREAVGLVGIRGTHSTPEVRTRLVEIRDELKALRAYRAPMAGA